MSVRRCTISVLAVNMLNHKLTLHFNPLLANLKYEIVYLSFSLLKISKESLYYLNLSLMAMKIIFTSNLFMNISGIDAHFRIYLSV